MLHGFFQFLAALRFVLVNSPQAAAKSFLAVKRNRQVSRRITVGVQFQFRVPLRYGIFAFGFWSKSNLAPDAVHPDSSGVRFPPGEQAKPAVDGGRIKKSVTGADLDLNHRRVELVGIRSLRIEDGPVPGDNSDRECLETGCSRHSDKDTIDFVLEGVPVV